MDEQTKTPPEKSAVIVELRATFGCPVKVSLFNPKTRCGSNIKEWFRLEVNERRRVRVPYGYLLMVEEIEEFERW